MNKVKKINDIKDININKLLEELAKERPIFHNEQDFQFELARKISETVSENIKVRLEYFIGETDQKSEEIGKKEKEKKNRIYIDIMIIQGNRAIAIELKYKTKMSEGKCKNEVFHLKDHGADDWGCYYIYNDLKRIETLVNLTDKQRKEYDNLDNINVEKGYVIFLTNDGEKYKKERKGIFKNYALNDQNGFVEVEEGEKYYCHKEEPYEIIKKDNFEEKIDYASVKGKKIIKFDKPNKGKWSEYSNLSKNNNDELNDIVDQLIFEVEKD